MSCFDLILEDEDIERFLMLGYYGFAEYAMLNWSDHLLNAVQLLDEPHLQSLASKIEIFLETHYAATLPLQHIPKELEKSIGKLQQHSFHDTLAQAILRLEKQKRPHSKQALSAKDLGLERFFDRI